MKAIVMEKFGGKDVLHMQDVQTPKPLENEVLIKVAYAGVNPVDWKIREGGLQQLLPHEFPIVPGWDLSGEVVEVGKNVQNFFVGDRVFAYIRKPTVRWGSYAEYATFLAKDVVKIPKELSMKEAAALPLVCLTAWQALVDTIRLQRGQSILILNGSGGVGCMAIQFAKNLGAKVFTTASSRKHEYVQQFKPDMVLDYKENYVSNLQKTQPQGFDVIFDCVGGDSMRKSLPLLKKGGTFVSIVDPQAVEEAKKQGINAHFVFVSPNGSELSNIASMFVQKKVIPPHIEEFTLKDAALAQEKQQEGHGLGKIVLKIQ